MSDKLDSLRAKLLRAADGGVVRVEVHPDLLRQAEAAIRRDATPALDVERLARAIGVIAIEDRDRVLAGDYSSDTYEVHASRIAEAYRAAESPTPKHPNGGCHKHPFGGTPERYACGHFCYEPPCLEVLEEEEATPGWPPQDS